MESFGRNNIKTLLFIPYALKDYEQYVKKIREVFVKWGKYVCHNGGNIKIM